MYNGKIARVEKKGKIKINFKSLLLWYLGIIVSFLPIIIDMFVYLSTNSKFNQKYWIEICLRGDLLWILATIIILTLIDYLSNEKAREKGRLKSVCAIVSLILWGVVFVIWCVFKYIYPENYEGQFPISVTIVLASVTLFCCSPLQVKIVEVEK